MQQMVKCAINHHVQMVIENETAVLDAQETQTKQPTDTRKQSLLICAVCIMQISCMQESPTGAGQRASSRLRMYLGRKVEKGNGPK